MLSADLDESDVLVDFCVDTGPALQPLVSGEDFESEVSFSCLDGVCKR